MFQLGSDSDVTAPGGQGPRHPFTPSRQREKKRYKKSRKERKKITRGLLLPAGLADHEVSTAHGTDLSNGTISSLPDADREGGLDPGVPGRGRERSVENSLEVLPYGHKTGGPFLRPPGTWTAGRQKSKLQVRGSQACRELTLITTAELSEWQRMNCPLQPSHQGPIYSKHNCHQVPSVQWMGGSGPWASKAVTMCATSPCTRCIHK